MLYFVKGCTEIVNDQVVGLCGYCCHKLDFTKFPNRHWLGPACKYLQNNLCSCYIDRPRACEGAPLFDYSCAPLIFGPDRFGVPWCTYRIPVARFYNIPYNILDNANECIERYAQDGLGSFERWTLKYFRKQTILYEYGK